MNREQKLEMFAMRLDGYTFQEIGDKYGVTGVAVREALEQAGRGNYWAKNARSRCVYKGLGYWIGIKSMNAKRISEKTGISSGTIERALKGENVCKNVIDAILKLSGLTYEEAFGERVDTEEVTHENHA